MLILNCRRHQRVRFGRPRCVSRNDNIAMVTTIGLGAIFLRGS